MEVQKRNIQLETDYFSLNLQVMRVSALQLLRPAMLICHIQDMRNFRRSGRYISLRLYTVDIWRSSNLKKREAWGPDVSFTRMRERQRSSWWMHRREFPRSSFPGREYPENLPESCVTQVEAWTWRDFKLPAHWQFKLTFKLTFSIYGKPHSSFY